ncbi:leukocyte-associated immunoglobulin-like receptor 1 isoform X3 [Sagmatias obliquidens]|uniref:leukocyte-associated immunoglobulin-like receptor 1 isoform X3 n=1 Tax=Sagmatias obliquidens TaxID=3371155 RepID=UPI000F44212D|nr:leukocyte-associated immunoglobulin-like receptor 1 isoform X3 [Lagenorhynchus obliquidens]
MSPRPTTLLGLVLCLGHTMHTQAGTLPSRSTRAEPDSVSPQGWPVTIVCRGPAGAEEFRLETKDNRSDFKDEKTVFQIGPYQTEARFRITAVSRDAAQHYQCLYRKDQASDQTLLTPRRHRRIRRTMTVLMREGDAEARARPADRASLYSHWGPCGLSPLSLSPGPFPPPSSAREKTGAPKKQRLSPAVDVADETPDLATVDRLPEKSGEVDTSASAAGGPQKVIYAQLDHPAFTQRVARAVSPLSTEPTAKSSMYAVLARN